MPAARHKSAMYHQLAMLSRSGVDLRRALRVVADNPPAASLQSSLRAWRETLESGAPLGPALGRTPGFTPMESCVVQAGERSGKLPDVFADLSAYWAGIDDARRKIVSGMIYPAIIIFVAAIASAVPAVGQGGAPAFLRALSGAFGMVLLAASILYLLSTAPFRPLIESLPVFGRLIRQTQLQRLLLALRVQVAAGIPILDALEPALDASGNPAWTALGPSIKARVADTGSLLEALRPVLRRDPEMRAILAVGIEAGRFDETFTALEAAARTARDSALEAVKVWAPRLVYFAAIAVAVVQVLRIAGSISGMYESISEWE